ncbi:DUF58 domain-containing protein [Pseudorhodobacter sp. W20_MBD10_FR17]|uniref:DUF58 domain-containing protein n=1 Tax=Pseudorhodobacter sp. W20_MBD10_FR17 TaxID=3240266 RepID=UPI003F94DC24
MEYAESRAYQPGDDIPAIDWRLTARSGAVHTKLFHEERERPVYVLLDLRGTMQFGTKVRFKAHLAAEIAAMLAWVGLDGGDRIGGFILTRGGLLEFPAARTRTAMLTFLHAASDATRVDHTAGQEVALPGALRNLRHACRPGTLAFIISDFADFGQQVETGLRRLAHRAHITMISVHDPMEQHLPPKGGRLSDGAAVLSLGQMGRADIASHADNFARRQAGLETLARKSGMVLHRIATPDDPKQLLQPMRSAGPTKRSAA